MCGGGHSQAMLTAHRISEFALWLVTQREGVCGGGGHSQAMFLG